MVYKAKGMIAAMYNIQKIKVLEHAKKILEKLLEEWLKKSSEACQKNGWKKFNLIIIHFKIMSEVNST